MFNYLIAVLAILLYLHGFFPIPPRPTQQVPPNRVTVTPAIKKAVLIVIDALRLDFISSFKTPFISKTYQETGCFIHLKVETPTVTLPRIKALTTGNVPQFIDIILNLASPTKVEDSFIHRAYANGKKIVFYGDDIWVKLFPDHFLRSEGTSSFFVNDYTEVDDNVTRNVKEEVFKKDWDIMILHYLGLDHIGHIYGPKSPLISTKLREMDSIIQTIYTKIGNDALILITGDHGMRDSGGHGGYTYPETNVPLIGLGMACENDSFAQIDIPSNLAILLGFDIPATSIGQLRSSLLKPLPKFQYLKALKYNTVLLQTKADLCQEQIETANHLLDLYSINQDESLEHSIENIYKDCAKDISERLQKTSVKQNVDSLIIATAVVVTVILKVLQKLWCIQSAHLRLEQFVIITVIFVQFGAFLENSWVLVGLILLNLSRNLMLFSKNIKKFDCSYLLVLSVVHPLIFLSSSFLEEEHQFWYFFTNTFIILNMFLKNTKIVKWFILSALIRFVRTINQVGDKWSSWPDLADWLLEKEHFIFLQIIFIVGIVGSFFTIQFHKKQSPSIDCLIFLLIFIFRTLLDENATLGKILWLLIATRFSKNNFLQVWVLIISLLLKPYNLILIFVCSFASHQFHKVLKDETLILSHWWLGNLFFFAQGHDNSLASVDISSGYVGLRNYEPLLVFPQVLCHTYAFPVLSHLLLFSDNSVDTNQSFSIFVLLRLYVVVVVFLVVFIQRHHLFIWSVFAPKMFVEASHFGVLFVEICCYCIGSLIKQYF